MAKPVSKLKINNVSYELKGSQVVENVSSYFSGAGVQSVYGAVKIGKIVHFSVSTTAYTKTANATVGKKITNLTPKYIVAVSVCVGNAANVYNNVTAQLALDGTLYFVGQGAFSNQHFIVSGVYIID